MVVFRNQPAGVIRLLAMWGMQDLFSGEAMDLLGASNERMNERNERMTKETYLAAKQWTA